MAQLSEASRLIVIGNEIDRSVVRGAARALGIGLDERPTGASPPADLEGARALVVCGVEHVRTFATLRRDHPGLRVVAALRGDEDPAWLLSLGVDDYVSLDAPEREIAGRLAFALGRAIADAGREDVGLHEVAELIDDLIGITTADGTRNLFLSRAYDAITGASRAEIMEDPHKYLRLVHPDDHHVLYDAHAHKDELHEYRYRILRTDGQVRWLHSRAFPARREDGTTARIITITRDVTDRTRAEDDAKAKHALLEGVTKALTTLLTAASPAGSLDRALAVLGPAALVDRVYVARHHRDDAGELRVVVTHEWVSEGTPRVLGGSESYGQRPPLPESRALLAMLEGGQSIALLRSELPESVRARLEPSTARSMLIVPVLADDGCWGQVGFVDCHAERRWDASARATLEATAAAVGSAIMRERAMEALAEQVLRVRSLFESAANPTLGAREQLQRMLEVGARLLQVETSGVMRIRPEDTTTAELRYVHGGDERMRAGARVPLARELWEPSVTENRPMAMADVVGTRFEGSGGHVEHGFRAFLGAPVWVRGQIWGGLTFLSVHARIRPFRDTDLDLARLLAGGVGHLIEQIEADEERSALDASLRETQKLESLGLLAGGIAHDLNNLLMGIMGHATVATRAKGEETAVVSESLEQIITITRRAASLTRQLLAYAGRDRVRIEPMSLSGLVREMTELLTVVLPKDARLDVDLSAELPPALGDAAQLQQVVMNLITNAGDALGGEPGTISIRTWAVDASKLPANGHLSFVRGAATPTSPPDAKTSVEEQRTERYVVLEVRDTGRGMDAATLEHIFEPFFTTKGPGRGLGLAAVLGIVRMHHGALVAESAPGVGTTFRLFLPAAAVPPKPARAEATPEARLLNVRVLVVDDTAQIRNTVKRILAMQGAEVLTAADGVEAVEHVERERERIDVVLLDLTMPRMDGARAHERIRELVPDMPILLMSGYAEGKQVERVLAQPRTLFMAKPFDAAELLGLLRALLTPDAA